MDSLVNPIKVKDLIPTLFKLFKKLKWRETFQTLYELTLPYLDNKTRQGHHKKRKLQAISLMNIDTKILNKILVN